MDWGSPWRKLVAAASVYGAGDRQKRKRSSLPDLPQLTCPPHPSPGIPLQSRQHQKCCLSHVLGYHVSSERQGVRVTGAVMRLRCFLSAQEKGFAGSGEGRNTGSWWGLAADFISLSEMVFTLVLRMEGLREVGKGRKLSRGQHQAHGDR